MTGEFDAALAVGEENEETISLAKAWCTNFRTDRGFLGVRMLEQMTGLRIPGGAFSCDHAAHPAEFLGMRLLPGAVSFYELNCRGARTVSRAAECQTWAPGRRNNSVRT